MAVRNNDRGEGNNNIAPYSGSASRFFYCAKPSKFERNAGCEELPKKEGGIKNTLGRSIGNLKDPYIKIMQRNNHPTVKSLSLMEYLIKLITPPKGIVLDMFAGSGSTLFAAQNLGFSFIGIEKDPEYVKIIQARLNFLKGDMFK